MNNHDDTMKAMRDSRAALRDANRRMSLILPILIIEDDPSMASFVKSVLETVGHEHVFVAENTDKAYSLLRRIDSITTILLSVNTSGSMTSADLAFRIVEEELAAEAKIFVVSTLSNDAPEICHIHDVLSDREIGYISKPFDRAELLETIV